MPFWQSGSMRDFSHVFSEPVPVHDDCDLFLYSCLWRKGLQFGVCFENGYLDGRSIEGIAWVSCHGTVSGIFA